MPSIMETQVDEEVPVLIVGSSMVGMSLSIMLASQGIKTIACERHPSTAIHPRAAFFLTRTIEIFRALGMMKIILQESEKHYDSRAGIVGVESLAGKKIASYLENVNAEVGALTPGLRLFLTQHMFEPLLRAKCKELEAELQFSTEVVDVEQNENGCISTIKNLETGATKKIKSQYVVSCDGSRSPMRKRLGINMIGYGEMSRSITIYFKADVLKYIDQKYNGVIYVNNETLRGFYRIDKNGQSGFLVVFTAGKQGQEESRYPADGITKEKAKTLLLAAIGVDIDCTIDMVMPWSAVSQNAEKYIVGRIFLAGDAAHTVPPTGGFGGNCGIHDAYNIAWKLALVLNKKAGQFLLKTYEQERLPIGTFTVDQAYARYVNRSAPELRDDRVHVEVTDFQFELGQRYHLSDACDYNGSDGGNIWEDPAEPTASAGSRAPHFWLDYDQKTSIHDIFSKTGYTLLVPQSHHRSYWSDASAALEGEFPIKTIVVSEQRFCSLYKVTHSGCVLVRPDGYIAWKAVGVQTEAATDASVCQERLRGVLRKVLCFDETGATVPTTTVATLVNGVNGTKIDSPMVNGVSEITGDKLITYLKEYIEKNEGDTNDRGEIERLKKENADLKKELAVLMKQGEKWRQLRQLLLTE